VVTDEGTRLERQAMTGVEGSFVIVGLPPGKYSVRVEMQGFRPFTRRGLVLTASQRLSIGTIEMTVGETSEAISVVAEAAAVNTASADTTAEISDTQLS